MKFTIAKKERKAKPDPDEARCQERHATGGRCFLKPGHAGGHDDGNWKWETRKKEEEVAVGEHNWEKSNLVTMPDGSDRYRCTKCGATSKRIGFAWPPKLDAKQPKKCSPKKGGR